MSAVGDCTHAQQLGHAQLCSMCQERHGIFSIEAMARGYHIYKSVWAADVGEEFEVLAKNRYRDIVSICSSANDCCGIGQRSRALKKFRLFKFSYKGWSIRNI